MNVKNVFVYSLLAAINSLYHSSALAAELRQALGDMPVYQYPVRGEVSPVNKLYYTFKRGDKVEVIACALSHCRVYTPAREVGWVEARLVFDGKSGSSFEQQIKNSEKMSSWDAVTKAVWNSFKNDMSMIDNCALKLAHGISFNTYTDWASYCNSFRDMPVVTDRVNELKAIISKSRMPENELDKLARGIIWIGASAEQALLAWGTPKKINRTLTANGAHEQWVYQSSYIYVDNGRVTGIQN